MSRQIRIVSIVLLAMFLALFGSTTYIQVFQASSLRDDARNTRVIITEQRIARGPILIAGNPIAFSTPNQNGTYKRTYTDGELYAPITGYYTVNQGSTGIEAAMNPELSGKSDAQFFSELQRLFTGTEPAGAAVEVTILPAAQRAAFDALGNRAGAVVAIDPSTGQILALVSKPGFDPNEFATGTDSEIIARYDEMLADPSQPLQNRAIGGNMNPPGSVFKLVVAAAAMENGIATIDSPLDNPTDWTLPGTSTQMFNPFHGGRCGDGDTTSLRIAIQYSCNIPFAQLAVTLGDDELRAMAAKFGFNEQFDLPMTSAASVYPNEALDDAQTALTGFGQFDVRATPLQIAMVSAAIANGGELMQPNLVGQVLTPSLEQIQGPNLRPYGQPISSATAEALTEMMRGSVASGVASNARIEGVDVAGKTGTAQNGPDDPYSLWFTGFAGGEDATSGRGVAVAVVLEDGGGLGQSGTGNGSAATIGQQVIKAVLDS